MPRVPIESPRPIAWFAALRVAIVAVALVALALFDIPDRERLIVLVAAVAAPLALGVLFLAQRHPTMALHPGIALVDLTILAVAEAIAPDSYAAVRFLALNRPDVARTLVLAEPPVHRWVNDVPGGKALLDQIKTAVWEPVRRAFESGDTEGAIRIFTDGIGGVGYFESLPAGARAARLQNAKAVQALMQSSDAFPALAREELQRLAVPTLIVEGTDTIRIHQVVDDELLRYIRGSERVIIPDAAHGAPRDNPDAFSKAVLGFLSRRG